MSRQTGHLIGELRTILEIRASELRARGELATVSCIDAEGEEPLLALEVSRKGGDWQRNLVITFEPDSGSVRVVVEIDDDERRPVMVVGDIRVTADELDHASHRLPVAGVDALSKELDHTE